MFAVSEFWDLPSGPVPWSLASTKISLLPKASVFPSAGFSLAIGSCVRVQVEVMGDNHSRLFSLLQCCLEIPVI